MRQPRHAIKLLAALTGGYLLVGTGCLSKQFAEDIATDAAREVADILIEALLIDPVDEAVNDAD